MLKKFCILLNCCLNLRTCYSHRCQATTPVQASCACCVRFAVLWRQLRLWPHRRCHHSQHPPPQCGTERTSMCVYRRYINTYTCYVYVSVHVCTYSPSLEAINKTAGFTDRHESPTLTHIHMYVYIPIYIYTYMQMHKHTYAYSPSLRAIDKTAGLTGIDRHGSPTHTYIRVNIYIYIYTYFHAYTPSLSAINKTAGMDRHRFQTHNIASLAWVCVSGVGR